MDEVIKLTDIHTRYGATWIHQGISLTVNRGEIIGLVGGSGSGKSTLLRVMSLLQRHEKGTVELLGVDTHSLDAPTELALRRRLGVMFQAGALFSSLTVLENVGVPLREHTQLDDGLIDDISALKLALVGLPETAADKLPSELSGGMIKRAAVARALALDPEILFLDEPTAGLDPIAAAAFDEMIVELRDLLGLTVVIVTHDLDTLWRVTDRVAVLNKGTLLQVGSMVELTKSDDAFIKQYLAGPRGRAAAQEYAWKTT